MELKVIQSLKTEKRYETCISVSLFKMNPKQVYRDFSKYVNKFMSWVRFVPKNAFVRLYVDENVLKDESFIRAMKTRIFHLEIVQFTYPLLLDDDGYHDGTFGSIIRFLPLFDEKLKVNYVWISDTDMSKVKFSNFYIDEMKRQKSSISYISGKCYFRDWILEPDFPIINYRLIVNVKDISKSREEIKTSFFEFIRNVLDSKYMDIKNIIINWQVESETKPGAKFIRYFPYGFDELYSNEILLPILSKYKRLIQLNFNPNVFKSYLTESQFTKLKEIGSSFWYENPDKKYFDKTLKFWRKLVHIVKPVMKDDQKSAKCLGSFEKYQNKIRYTKGGDFVALFTV